MAGIRAITFGGGRAWSWRAALVVASAWWGAEFTLIAAERRVDAAAKREGQAGILARPAIGFEPAAGREVGLGERLIVDCRDGRVDEFGFLEASLIASGVDS